MANVKTKSETSIIEEIVSDLLDRNDGPVTVDVVIARNSDLIKRSHYTGEQLGKAMFEAFEILKENGGWLATNERLHY